MSLLFIALAVLGAGLLTLWFVTSQRRASLPPSGTGGAGAATRTTPPPARPAPARAAAEPARPSPLVEPASATAEAVPPALATLHLRRAHELPDEQRQALVRTFRDIPRPPKLLQHLLSPAFFNAASSRQLVELIASEPLIASRVLAAVNSPRYGLSAPVSSVGQAVTYLGLNSVRALCLQYILTDAFKADSPERQQALEATWRASALATELAQQLAGRLNLPDIGPLVSAVVLSFLGRLGTAAVMPRSMLGRIPARDLLQRAQAEQELLGLCASEIGRLLMADWGLPERIVADAADIDRQLLADEPGADPARAAGLAVAYLSARLGERLAAGERIDLLGFVLASQTDAECHHLRRRLVQPALAGLPAALNWPVVNAAVERVQATFR